MLAFLTVGKERLPVPAFVSYLFPSINLKILGTGVYHAWAHQSVVGNMRLSFQQQSLPFIRLDPPIPFPPGKGSILS